MHQLKLSTLAAILGLAYALPNIYGLAKPAAFGAMARKFPRYTPAGYVLVIVATVWFLFYVNQEDNSDFASFKRYLMAFFGLVGIGTCLYVKDYLAVRGLAATLLVLAKLMVDTARWVDTEWRLVIVTWAYVMIVAGIWFTIAPWRLRDLLNWANASAQRTRALSGLRLAFAVFVVVLALTAIRAAETSALAAQ
jgi:hypothetical protein